MPAGNLGKVRRSNLSRDSIGLYFLGESCLHLLMRKLG